MNIIVNEEMMENSECYHDWKVTTDEDNFPEDVMCSRCKEVVIMIEHEGEQVDWN